MDQIPKDDESRGVPVVAERQQGIQGSSIAITRDGDALDLEAFRFAKVESATINTRPSSRQSAVEEENRGTPDPVQTNGSRTDTGLSVVMIVATVRPSGGFPWQMRPCRCVTCF